MAEVRPNAAGEAPLAALLPPAGTTLAPDVVLERFVELCRLFGPENVGMMTGDGAVNRDAPILCCTAEILMNLAVREAAPRVDAVVMDEFHYYGDRDRGVAWQVPLLVLERTRFLLMSATLGDTSAIEASLREVTGRE